jgi:hypothetical protein
MIQKYLKDLLATNLPGLEWSIELYSGADNTGTVLTDTPSSGEVDDEREFLFPGYQVYLRSSDFEKIEFYALRVYEILNKRKDDIATREYKDGKGNTLGSRSYRIIFIECDNPIRVGLEGKHLDYSINFRVILKEVK